MHRASGGNYSPARLPGETLHADLITVPTGEKTSTTMVVVVDELSSLGIVADVVSKAEAPLKKFITSANLSYKGASALLTTSATIPKDESSSTTTTMVVDVFSPVGTVMRSACNLDQGGIFCKTGINRKSCMVLYKLFYSKKYASFGKLIDAYF